MLDVKALKTPFFRGDFTIQKKILKLGSKLTNASKGHLPCFVQPPGLRVCRPHAQRNHVSKFRDNNSRFTSHKMATAFT